MTSNRSSETRPPSPLRRASSRSDVHWTHPMIPWVNLSNGLTWCAVSSGSFALSSVLLGNWYQAWWSWPIVIVSAYNLFTSMALTDSAKLPCRASSHSDVPWFQISVALIGYAVSSSLFVVSSVPGEVVAVTSAWALSWVAAMAWFVSLFVAVTSAAATARFVAVNSAVCGVFFVATGLTWVASWTMNWVWAVNWVVVVAAIVLMITTARLWIWVASTLLQSFSGVRTLLMLAGTSLAGLGLGWLIGMIW